MENFGGISSSESMSWLKVHYQCDRRVLNLDGGKTSLGGKVG